MPQRKPLNAETCRKQAANCLEAAKSVMSPSHRIMLEHIAETWERIAAEIDKRNEQTDTVRT
jgi:hypothetical protein